MDYKGVLEEIKKISGSNSEKAVRRYNFQLTERIILRLASFQDCAECKGMVDEFSKVIGKISGFPLELKNKTYFGLVKLACSHLQNRHKLVVDNYYSNIYMSIGLALSLPFGVAFSSMLGQMAYIGAAMPIGIAIGLSIGHSMDAKAKKNGLVI